jgi:hypothetical protein
MIYRRIKVFFILIWIITCITGAQTVNYQYDYHREESPAISWNGIHFFDSKILSLSGISMMASDPFAAVLNPALIPDDGKVILGVSYGSISHEAFQYWGVNQGVVTVPEPLSNRNTLFNGLSGTLVLNKFRISIGSYFSGLLQYPTFEYREEYEYGQYYSYKGTFAGNENTYYIAAATKLGNKFDVGFKLEYVSGQREVDIEDTDSFWEWVINQWVKKSIVIIQSEDHHLSLIRTTLGVNYQISPDWSLGAFFILPFGGKAERTVTRSFENFSDDVFISETQNTDDTLYRPVQFNVASKIHFPLRNKGPAKKRFTLAAELKYSLWSTYKYILFDENIPRDMRNTLVMALGGEYGSFTKKRDFFIRLGTRLDPQPIKDPNTLLLSFSGGVGIRLSWFAMDLGISYFTASTSGEIQEHYMLNSTFIMRL